jgi:Zn-finger nucleic acid-binding protein
MPDPDAEVALTTPCPRCNSPLLALPFDGGAKIHPCGTCRGLFVPARAWCTFIERPQLATALEKRIPPAKMTPGALVSLVRCASCNQEMERGRVAASSPIVVDVCVRHGVWLDAGELGEVVDFVAKRARGEAHAATTATGAATAGGAAGAGGGVGTDTFVRGPRVVVVRGPVTPPSPPPSRLSWIVRSVLVALVFGVAVRVGIYWFAKKQGIGHNVGESSAAAADEANKVLSR